MVGGELKADSAPERVSAVCRQDVLEYNESIAKSRDPAPIDGHRDDSIVDLANSRLTTREAIAVLTTCNAAEVSEKFAPFNLQAFDETGRWYDNGSLKRGDSVDLFAVVNDESRLEAAQRILSVVDDPSGVAFLASLGDEADVASIATEFPLACLPEPLFAMAQEISAIENAPNALAAACLLSAVSGSIGRGMVIPSKPGKTTTANLYILIEAETGDGKSSADEWAVAPIEAFVSGELAKFNAAQPMLKARLTVVDREIKDLSQQKPDESARENHINLLATAEAAKADLLKKMSPPCFLTSNATSQALAELMSQNNGMMMSRASDSRGVLAIVMGRHENDKNRTDDEFYLAAWTVRESVRVHRISRPDVVIDRPCLAIFWLIQDDMFEQLWRRTSLLVGGFLTRFLTCRVQATPQFLNRETIAFREDIRDSYHRRLTELFQTYRIHMGGPFVVGITPQAQTAMFDYADRVIERRKSGEFTAMEQRFTKRWAENAWRMALVLHAAEFGARAHCEAVGIHTAESAIRIVSWFSLQQLAILREREEKEQGSKEDRVMNLVRRHSRVNTRSLKKAEICSTNAEAKMLLQKLVSDSMLEAHDHSGRGPATRYFVLPANRRA